MIKYVIVIILFLNNVLDVAFSKENNTYSDYGSFLNKAETVNSYMILPGPPSDESLIWSNDKLQYKQSLTLSDSDLWKQARDDADTSDNGIGKQFSSVLGLKISKEETPKFHSLMLKLRKDNSLSISYAKDYYKRVRPFILFKNKTCRPEDEPFLKPNGSYPSGHSALGWEIALILAEIVPERSSQILKRGFDYGQSRVVCGAHWQSDVDSGRIIGAAVLSRLKANNDFNKAFEEVKEEIRDKIYN